MNRWVPARVSRSSTPMPSMASPLAGNFTDPGLPAGYAPFGIQAINGKIFVTFAKQDADARDEIAGSGFGFVSAFGMNGTFLGRVASRGALNAPWGLAWAPATGFGRFSGNLLVGNFGDGRINAYAWTGTTWEARGHLKTANHHPLSIDGLWGIGFGNGAGSGPVTTLYFAAGPNDESQGLFGSITAN
ncbi:MAG: TIGR03118 family protein [Chloroflexi bacterium]|nr:MAG: TIGR03118 family protein [Chloroflexota bacterium]